MAQLQTTRFGDSGEPVAAVAEFLRRFGYLRTGNQERMSTDIRFDDGVEEAIARYQRAHALPETGVLEPETLRMMNTPRCGVSDAAVLSKAMLFGTAHGWGRRDLTFAIDLTEHLPPLGVAVVRQEVSAALGEWASAGGLTFTEHLPANIFIGFRQGDHGDGAPDLVFDRRPGGRFGHGFVPTHPSLAGHVHLDADEQWSITVPVNGSADLLTLLLHEIGHALGLEHNLSDPTAVMSERFDIGTLRRTLVASDIQSVRAIYP